MNINDGCGSCIGEIQRYCAEQRRGMSGIAHDGDADRVLLCDENGRDCGWRRDSRHRVPGSLEPAGLKQNTSCSHRYE